MRRKLKLMEIARLAFELYLAIEKAEKSDCGLVCEICSSRINKPLDNQRKTVKLVLIESKQLRLNGED